MSEYQILFYKTTTYICIHSCYNVNNRLKEENKELRERYEEMNQEKDKIKNN